MPCPSRGANGRDCSTRLRNRTRNPAPVPSRARPLVETVNFITIALLPDRIRSQYGFAPLPPPMLRKALVNAGAAYIRHGVLPLLPARVRQSPAARRAA